MPTASPAPGSTPPKAPPAATTEGVVLASAVPAPAPPPVPQGEPSRPAPAAPNAIHSADDRNPSGWVAQGDTLVRDGHGSQAAAAYERAAGQGDADAAAKHAAMKLWGVAGVPTAVGADQAAQVAALDQAADRGSAVADVASGAWAEQHGDLAHAAADYRRALAADPHDPAAVVRLVRLRLDHPYSSIRFLPTDPKVADLQPLAARGDRSAAWLLTWDALAAGRGADAVTNLLSAARHGDPYAGKVLADGEQDIGPLAGLGVGPLVDAQANPDELARWRKQPAYPDDLKRITRQGNVIDDVFSPTP